MIVLKAVAATAIRFALDAPDAVAANARADGADTVVKQAAMQRGRSDATAMQFRRNISMGMSQRHRREAM